MTRYKRAETSLRRKPKQRATSVAKKTTPKGRPKRGSNPKRTRSVASKPRKVTRSKVPRPGMPAPENYPYKYHGTILAGKKPKTKNPPKVIIHENGGVVWQTYDV